MFLKNVLAICPLRLILWYPFIEFLIPRRLLSQAVTINASLIGRAFTQGNVFVDNTVRRNLISRAKWDGLELVRKKVVHVAITLSEVRGCAKEAFYQRRH